MLSVAVDYSQVVFPGGYSPAETALDGQWFDHDAAELVIRFVQTQLTFPDGERAGEPFELEEWEREFLATLFGWKNPDGTRRYRETYFSTARGNGKSPLAATVAAVVLVVEPGTGKQVYSIAGNQQQAAIVFDDAKMMIRANPRLDAVAECYKWTITISRTGSKYQALTSKPGTKHGLRANLVLCDELHEFKNRELLDALVTSQGKRRQPLTVVMTTAGVYDDTSICWEQYYYAKRVISGEVQNAAFLPVIYELGPEDDWRDEANWVVANPNLGVSVNLAFLRNECEKAKAIPAYQNVFRRLYCNQWVEQVTRWMDMAKWDAAGESFDDEDCTDEFIAGLDLGECDDLSSLAQVFRVEDRVKVRMRFWLPEDAIGKNPLYRVWADQGFLTITDSITHYDAVRQELVDLRLYGQLLRLLVDRYQAGQMTAELVGTYGKDHEGKDRVQFYGQGFASMTGPIRELEKLISQRKIDGLDHPILHWMAQNADAKQGDNMAIKLVKPRDGSRKIDGLIALVMALAALPDLKDAPSFAQTGGLRKL